MKRVLVALPTLNENQKEKLRSACPGCEISFINEKEITPSNIDGVEIIIGSVPPAMLHSPNPSSSFRSVLPAQTPTSAKVYSNRAPF